MKFRIIHLENEIAVITEDGGVATIMQPEITDENDRRTAITDYYKLRITELKNPNKDNVWDLLAEGKSQYNEWTHHQYNDLALITNALNWLAPKVNHWELVEDIFTDVLPKS